MKKILVALLLILVMNNIYATCTASFTASPYADPINPLGVMLNNTSTVSLTGPGQQFVYTVWWGDGTMQYVSTGNTTHNYTIPGNYTIGLTSTVYDSSTLATLCYDSTAYTITISRCAAACYFSATTTGNRINTVAHSYSGSPTIKYTWDWHDHTGADTGVTATHVYPYHSGVYVSVTAVDSNCSYNFGQVVYMGSTNNYISGTIYQDDSATAIPYPQYKVWLINYDSATTSLSAVDSQILNGNSVGYRTVYQFDSATTGTYRIKAQLLNGPSSGTGALPTYATSALMWNSASILYHSGDDLGQDINLQYGTVTGGPGFISGNVSAGANKGTKDGIPGMNVFLMDYNKKAIAYAITDINGDYSFNKVPVGNYSIYPESMSYYTTAGTATITTSSATISNVDFLRSEKHKTIMPNTTGITVIEKEVLSIYPNPAKDRVIINMNNPAETKSDLTIFNMNGQKLYQQSFNGNHTEVDLKGWAKGIYFIKIENENLRLIRKLTLE
ncbi:MAG: hypothetical protein BGO70_05705 [Bacteroidetes bacterium 43-93]|nr:T9SS type A sorting domain-containing protein [Bacteroidota bacterium]OJW96893.1 MAG: hypothetical protein BGO70_05705 [Bacteroidetes bacterium 43-93]